MVLSGRILLCLVLGVAGLQGCSSGGGDDPPSISEDPPNISVVSAGSSTTGAVDNGVNEGSFPIQPTSGTEP